MPDFDSEASQDAYRERVSDQADIALSKGLRDKVRQLNQMIKRNELKHFLRWIKNQDRAFLSEDDLITAYQEDIASGNERQEDQPSQGAEASP